MTAAPGARLPLYALLTGSAVSYVGNVLSAIALPWFVLVTTGSAAKTGVTAFFTTLPLMLAAFFGGTLVDRLGYKRTSVIADVASGVAVALVPLLYATVGLGFWSLMVLVFLGAVLDQPGRTARSSLLPDLATTAGMRLERANSLTQAIERGSRMVGAPIAGGLIAVLGAEHVLWLNAASFAVSAALTAAFIPHSPPATAEQPGGYLEQLGEGLRWIRSDRLVLVLIVTVAITNFLDAPVFSVIMPVFAERAYGSAVPLGFMFAAMGGGSVAGALVYGAVGHRLPRRALFIWAFVATGIYFWVLAIMPPLAVVLAVLTISGIAAGPLNPILGTVFQERIPPQMRGRVFGLISAVAMAATPFGAILGGLMLDWLGVRGTLVALALAYLVVTLSFLVQRSLREMGGAKGANGRPNLTPDPSPAKLERGALSGHGDHV